MKRKRENNVGVDSISGLPECIIHQIMSRLSKREAARTSVLSKAWYRFYKNYPVLVFHFDRFVRNLEEEISKETPEFRKSLKTYRKRVYKSLRRFLRKNISLQVFCFVNCSPDTAHCTLVSEYDNWIGLALKNMVKELKIYSHAAYDNIKFYTLPQPVFSSTTLTTLKLFGCFLDQPLSVFSSLKKLSLRDCHLIAPIILKGFDCPVLECLSLRYCSGFCSVNICNLLRLHTVELISNQHNPFDKSVKVEIASLIIQKLIMEVGPTKWSDINIDACHCLKFLHLGYSGITDDVFHSLVLKFPLLEELYVFNCAKLKTIRISSPRLITLAVGLLSYHPVEIEIAASSLKNFIFSGFLCGPGKIPTVIKVADCCRGLETLVLCSQLMTDTEFNKLISMFPWLENVWIISCDELQRIKIPRLEQLKRLHVIRCSKLEAVKFDGSNSIEMCYSVGTKGRDISLADPDHRCTRLECGVDCSSRAFWGSCACWEEMLTSLVKDSKHLVSTISWNFQ